MYATLAALTCGPGLVNAGRDAISNNLASTISKYEEVLAAADTFDQDNSLDYGEVSTTESSNIFKNDQQGDIVVAASDGSNYTTTASSTTSQQPMAFNQLFHNKPVSFWESFDFHAHNPFNNLNMHVNTEIFDRFNTNFLRSGFHPAVQNYLTQYDRYGCWCYFDEESKYGKGPVQNGFDANCRILALGYRCIAIDSVNRDDGEVCEEPWTVPYTAYAPWLPGTVTEQCVTNNPDSVCAQEVCQVESSYSNNLFTYIMSEQDVDPDLSHEELVFDPYLECSYGEYDFLDEVRACCGEYETGRVPYRPDHDQACCGSAVYNELSQCCEDASVSSVLPMGGC